MNEKERAICDRLRELRRAVGWSQTEFAHALGANRDQVASVEYGRNPLRYWQADRACEKLDVCQQWLASGAGPVKGYVQIPPEMGLEIKPRELFSSAWFRRVGHLVKKRVAEAEAANRLFAQDSNAARKVFENRLYYLEMIAKAKIPPEHYDDYFSRLASATSAFIVSMRQGRIAQKAPAGRPDEQATAKDSEKSALQNVSVSDKYSDVRPLWPEFRDGRLKKAAGQRGRKSALAKFLKVPLSSVSQWLSGDREPGGETTLRMLYWVELQERQSK